MVNIHSPYGTNEILRRIRLKVVNFIFYGGPQLSHQIQITHIKYKLLTSKTNYSHQIQKSRHQKQDSTVSGWRTKTMFSFHSALSRPPVFLLHMVLSSGCFAATAGKVS